LAVKTPFGGFAAFELVYYEGGEEAGRVFTPTEDIEKIWLGELVCF
jgi:hypothetical protein